MKIPHPALDSEKAWKIILIWFFITILIFTMAREWGVVTFGLTYGIVFGGLAYRYRKMVRQVFNRIGMLNYRGYLLLSIFISMTEETYCYLLGNRIAVPMLWKDLVLVSTLWSVWFGTWYFYISREYTFNEKEALLTAGATGVLYENIGTGYFFQNPPGMFLGIPLAVVIYAAIFVLPMQLMEFKGTKDSMWKYPAGAVLPFVLTVPVAVTLFLLFSLAGHPLDQ